MRRRRGTILISIAAGLALLLTLVNIVLVELNRRVQLEVAGRSQILQQRAQLDTVNRELVSAIANLAIERNDDALKTALADHGITLNITPRGQSPAPAAQPAPRR